MAFATKQKLTGFLAVILLYSTFTAQVHGEDVLHRIAIESQPLKTALVELSSQADIAVYATAEVVGSKMASPINGEMTAEAALLLLLADTGLTYVLNKDGTYAIVKSVKSIESTEDSTKESSVLEEVVVTAQRREEKLGDVPISISALRYEDVKKLGVSSTMDLPVVVPGLDIKMENNSVSTFLRGVGSTNTNGVETAVTLYIDGVYYPSLPANALSLSNVERIEVLKGPQGTLFGRNATGGVIQVITKTPSQETSGEIGLTYANYDTYEADLYATMGVTESAATDFSFYIRRQNDGWGDYINKNGEDALTTDSLSIRNKWLWEVSENTEIIVSAGYSKLESDVGSANSPVPPSKALDGLLRQSFYDNRSNGINHGTVKNTTTSITINHDFDAMQFASITGYQKVDNHILFDQDQTALPLVQVNVTQKARSVSQEFQLLSDSDSPLQWIAGLYLFDFVNDYTPIALSGAAFSSPSDLYSKPHMRSYASFAQATYPVMERTNLTLGIRYTKDKLEFESSRVTPTSVTVNPDRTLNSEEPTWRASLDHRFSDQVLGYISYNRGFRSGGFNVTSQTEPAVLPEQVDAYEIGVKANNADGTIQFDVAAFYYDLKNLQLLRTATGGNSLYNAANAEVKGIEAQFTAKPFSGLTLTGGLSLLDGEYKDFPDATFYFVRVNGGASTASGNADGNETIRTPDISFNLGARYEMPLENSLFAVALNYSYTSEYYFEPQNILQQPKTHLVNGTLSWLVADEQLEYSIWGNNLLGEKYYSRANPQSLGLMASPAAPREYGVTVNYYFR